MAKPPTSMATSVKDRLLNIARKEGRAFDVLLVRFALERLLYRLSVSAHRDCFVLKGGMLVTIWVADDNRVTRDADFLGHGDSDPDHLVTDFQEIMAIESDDGLAFDINALAATIKPRGAPPAKGYRPTTQHWSGRTVTRDRRLNGNLRSAANSRP